MFTGWRAAARSFGHRRGLAATIVATLALGIGANSAIFSAVDAVLLKPLPYPGPDRLVMVYERNVGLRQATQLVAPGRLEEWNAANRTLDGLAASYFENTTDTSGPLPERVEAMSTSPRFFSVLGVAAALGRTPTAAEERFGGRPVVVVSDGFWRRRLGADPAVVGRTLTLGTVSRTIIGVMPPSFHYPTVTTDVWLPTRAPAGFLSARGARLYKAIGRLKPGVTLEQAQADLSAVQAQLGEQFPETDRGWGAALLPFKDEQVGALRRSLGLLVGAVGLVLLAACGNIACLLLADAGRRRHEIAVRLALGADRGLVVRQLLREGILLALTGSLLGLAIGRWGVAAIRTLAGDVPQLARVSVDWRVIAFTFGIGMASTILFAVMPAVLASRRDPADALSRGGRTQAGGRQGLQRLLVAAQVALAIVLLAGAGLLARSFIRIQQIAPGFDASGVLTFRMSAQWTERMDAVIQRHARTLERLAQVPGVEASAFSQVLPAGADLPPTQFQIVGRDTREKTFATGRAVSSGYFHALRIPILQGQTCSDDPAARPFSSALVTQSFVERFFPDRNPIGQRFLSPGTLLTERTVVGVVGDVREAGVLKAPEPLIYWCGQNPYWPDPFFLVRVAPGRSVPMATLRAALREIEPGRAVYAARPLVDLLDASLFQQRAITVLLGLFAVTAVTLAALGLYGVLTQAVAARRREIGVRIALGATPRAIVTAIVGQAGAMTGAGIVAGLVLALGTTRLMATFVFGVSARDPITFVIVPAVLAAIAGLASFLPARRAATTDPMRVLREE